MRYYCKYCKSELKTNKTGYSGYCPICYDTCDHIAQLKVIPNYETVVQWEKRTGEKYPDNGLVLVRCKENKTMCTLVCKIPYRWVVVKWRYVRVRNCNGDFLVADPPVPPPEDWKPEEEV
jgi:hypothetical protein